MSTGGLNNYSFELGPIRPPSEAYSLLIRATRNCPWNRCEFCPQFKGQRFELRSVEEIKHDIEVAGTIRNEIGILAGKMGYVGRTREVAAMLCSDPRYNASVRNVALWLYGGEETVFLQDADTLIMRTPELVQVLAFVKETLPQVTRITSYGRSKTAAKKSVSELRELQQTGLSRLHIGLETGYDPLLQYMQKGATAEEHIRGGTRVREAGISLCEYVMPGLGGKRMSKEHMEETARVLNQINSDYIRLRSLEVREDMLLHRKLQDGDFELQSEDEVVEEIGELIERLTCHSTLKSDHVLNLLPEVDGVLPQDKEKMLAPIKRYLSLPAHERLNFRFGRRIGYYQQLDEVFDSYKHERVEQLIRRAGAEVPGGVEEAILAVKGQFL